MLDWQDGQPYSRRFGDVYFSADSGLEETRHVFLQGNRLAQRFAALESGASFCVGELGFGTGLNFLCAWALFAKAAPRSASLDCFSVEKYPLTDDEMARALALWPTLREDAAVLAARWRRRVPGWNRWHFAGGRVRLTLALADVADALPELPGGVVDAWFLDGFAPARNPEMWSEPVLADTARASRAGATAATYSSAGGVRRGLQRAGFAVEKVRGFGRKREMLRAVLVDGGDGARPALPADAAAASVAASHRPPATAVVIGGGIAGCTAAHALAQRGVAVTLVERAPELASAASGNPLGVLHARFGAGAHPLHRLVLAAYGHALALYDDVLPVDGTLRAECGLLQLACTELEAARIGRMAEREWPAPLLQFADAGGASELAGVPMRCGGLWFPAGGWVVPARLCARLVEGAAVALRLGHAAQELARTAGGWRVAGCDVEGAHWAIEADVALVCCALAAAQFEPLARFPLTPVRGQITQLPATPASRSLRAIVCGEGYCAPAADDVHVVGATHAIGDAAADLRVADHAENLARLAAYAPALREAFGDVDPAQLLGRAGVRCSLPGAVPLVGRVDAGLHCSVGHGTRGLVTAGIAGEALAAAACRALPPLPATVLAALAPEAQLPGVRLRKRRQR
jgi:tRNA 5-methylaminomethyl-2-thiouridine biosynthesis bifunctional protein